ncbi:MAG: hypothetical protein HQL11_05755, partial [Candidatus Omnitrophica bacterium]|nr:hypothetical protein [Candidatus Omnitrophota bacterium]
PYLPWDVTAIAASRLGEALFKREEVLVRMIRNDLGRRHLSGQTAAIALGLDGYELPVRQVGQTLDDWPVLPVRATVYAAAALCLADHKIETSDPVYRVLRGLSGNPVDPDFGSD